MTDLVNLLRDRMLEKSTITVDDELTQIIRKTIAVSIGWDSRLPGGIDPRYLIKKSSLIITKSASEVAGTAENINYLPENLEGIIAGKSFYVGNIDLKKAEDILNSNA